MITVQSLAVDLNNGVVETLKKAALSTAEDKQTWKPLDEGRSALDQIAECALITDFAAKMLIEKACPEFSNEAYGAGIAALDTMDKAIAALDASWANLKSVILDFPTEDLEKSIMLPWFPDPQTFANIMFIALWNNTYHIGQINYIQTLYGDKEMH